MMGIYVRASSSLFEHRHHYLHKPPPMEAFFGQWIIQEQHLLNHLLSVPQDRPDLHIPLISQALAHYAEYYNRRSQLANRDVFQVLSAFWLTPFERSFLWIGGLKPRMIFRFLPSDLSNDQRRQIENLQQQTVEREVELERRMRQVEEAAMVLMALAAVHGNVRNGEARGDAVVRVAEIMRTVFDEADRLRKHVASMIIGILSTAQTVRFLASAASLHLRMRRFGLRHAGA